MNFHILSLDRICGIVAIFIGSVCIGEYYRLLPMRTSTMVGDHILPGLAGLALIALGLLLIFFVKSKPIKAEVLEKAVLIKIVTSICIMILYTILMLYVGYIISTFLAGMFLFRMYGNYKWSKCIIFALISAVVFYVAFSEGLGMSFPPGIFDDI